jgi:hypothetical protein
MATETNGVSRGGRAGWTSVSGMGSVVMAQEKSADFSGDFTA